ncbi:MAG TPA: SDR family oxidoreductase [Chloroflexi bacterium]|nr:SDR family oxidoreductase [Chloroflexota bacterium]
MARRRMLVTGGSGYLGDWIVRLARDDWDVSATYRTHPPTSAVPGVAWYRLDVRDEAAVRALLQKVRPAALVHTAALNPGMGPVDDLDAVNVGGPRHVSRAAAAVGARLIHVSTDVLFDGTQGNYAEAEAPSPVTPYGRSKAGAEEAVQNAVAQMDVEAVIVRTSLIYGWRPRRDRQSRWVVDDVKAGKRVRLFTDEYRCPVWVESLAAAVVELAGMAYTGVLHVAGAQALSRYDFGLRLLRFYGVAPDAIAAHVVPSLAAEAEHIRPLDCTLDCFRARSLLETPLPGVDVVLGGRSFLEKTG